MKNKKTIEEFLNLLIKPKVLILVLTFAFSTIIPFLIRYFIIVKMEFYDVETILIFSFMLFYGISQVLSKNKMVEAVFSMIGLGIVTGLTTMYGINRLGITGGLLTYVIYTSLILYFFFKKLKYKNP